MDAKAIRWAQDAAAKIVEQFGDAAAVDTANYQLCEFIVEAARLVLNDPFAADYIGRAMEPERPKD